MHGISAPDSGITSKKYAKLNFRFILLVSIIAALGRLLFDFDTAIISGTIPFITQYSQLQNDTLGAAVNSVLVGCVIGAFFTEKMANRSGRRYVLFVYIVLLAVSGVGAALSQQLSVFIFSRIIGALVWGLRPW
jgi:MFS family permease